METSGQIHAPDTVTLGESPGVGALGGLMNPRVSLETIKKRKIDYLPAGNRNAMARFFTQ